MTTIERRLTDLERERAAFVGPLVLIIDGEPTAEQRRAIEEAERVGRPVVLGNSSDAQA